MAEIWEEIAKIPQGIPALQALQGVSPHIEYQPGLNIIAAPTSAGKTTYLIAQVTEWLLNPNATGKILFWSAETSRAKVWAKILAHQAHMELGAVLDEVRQSSHRHRAGSPKLDYARQTMDGVSDRLIVLDSAITATDLIAIANRLHQAPDGLYALVVDYLQELPAVSDNHPWAARFSHSREQEVGYIARTLRDFGMQTGVPVLAAAQFNRTVGKSSGYVPELLQLRESGRIEQNASLVLGLRNETMSGVVATVPKTAETVSPKTYHAWDTEALETAQQGAMASVRMEHPHEDGWILLEAFVLKNREHGGVGTVIPMVMNETWGRIEPLTTRITVHGGKRKTSAGNGQAVGANSGQEANHDDDDDFFARA